MESNYRIVYARPPNSITDRGGTQLPSVYIICRLLLMFIFLALTTNGLGILGLIFKKFLRRRKGRSLFQREYSIQNNRHCAQIVGALRFKRVRLAQQEEENINKTDLSSPSSTEPEDLQINSPFSFRLGKKERQKTKQTSKAERPSKCIDDNVIARSRFLYARTKRFSTFQ